MKHLTISLFFFLCLSCKIKHSEVVNHENVTSLDTVFIDSKGHLLDLRRNILISDLDDEDSDLLLYNAFDHSFDEINLVNFEISNNFSFESEGPNGIGNYVNGFKILEDGFIFIKSFNESAVINRNGLILNRIDWVNAIDSKGLKYGEVPRVEVAVDYQNLKVFGLNFDEKKQAVFLDVLSVKDNSVKRFEIDSEKSYHSFVLEIDDPDYRTFMDPYVDLRAENNLILISHQYSNEIFLFNFQGEFVQTVFYNTELTPSRVKKINDLNITSREQLQKQYQHFLEQVRFGPLVWDKDKNRYLRLSAVRIFSDNPPAEGSLLPEIQEVKVYLSVFDNNFNMVTEVQVPELSTEFVKYFAKDGKLWVYQNFSDELGFLVLDI